MACAVRSRIEKWDLIKLQSFCKATKRPPTDWERIFTYPKSDRGLISNIYKELKKVDSKKSNNPIKKWGWGVNKEFLFEEYRIAEKHLKKIFKILNHQGNANQKNPEIPPHTSQNGLDQNFRWLQMLARMWRKRNSPPLLVGLQAYTTTLEISLVVPQKIEHSTTGGSSNTSPGHISRRCPNR